jgi:hypothetical protein
MIVVSISAQRSAAKAKAPWSPLEVVAERGPVPVRVRTSLAVRVATAGVVGDAYSGIGMITSRIMSALSGFSRR